MTGREGCCAASRLLVVGWYDKEVHMCECGAEIVKQRCRSMLAGIFRQGHSVRSSATLSLA